MCKSLRTALWIGFITIVVLTGCAGRGLITDHYDPEFYRVEHLLPADTENGNPAFLVYGDNQGCFRLIENFGKRHNWWTWKQALIPFYQLYWLGNGVVGAFNGARMSADGGKRTRLMMRDAVYQEAIHSKLDFILNVGDICTHDGRRPAHWRKFLIENKTSHPLLREIPYLPAAGNHERTTDSRWGLPNYRAVFDYPPFYKRQFKDIALFVLDSEIICDLFGDMEDSLQDSRYRTWYISGDPEHPAWLERELAACDKPFKIVAMHIPPISFGRHFRDWTGEHDYGLSVPQKRRELLNLFHESGVQVVFSGHEHIYQHNILAFENDSLHVVVSSGGGVPLRHLPSAREVVHQQEYFDAHQYDVANVMMRRTFHYCLVSIENDQLTIRTMSIDDSNREPQLIEEIRVSP